MTESDKLLTILAMKEDVNQAVSQPLTYTSAYKVSVTMIALLEFSRD